MYQGLSTVIPAPALFTTPSAASVQLLLKRLYFNLPELYALALRAVLIAILASCTGVVLIRNPLAGILFCAYRSDGYASRRILTRQETKITARFRSTSCSLTAGVPMPLSILEIQRGVAVATGTNWINAKNYISPIQVGIYDGVVVGIPLRASVRKGIFNIKHLIILVHIGAISLAYMASGIYVTINFNASLCNG